MTVPIFRSIGSLFILIALGWGIAPRPSLAAETLTLRLGFLERTVRIGELETYVKTGELSPSLQPISAILTPSVRDLLQKNLHVDQVLAQQFLEDLFRDKEGEQLLRQLNTVILESNPQQIQETIDLTLKKPDKINIFSFLKAYPSQNLTLDMVALTTLTTQLNQRGLESSLLGDRLTHSLQTTEKKPVPKNFSPDRAGDRSVYKRQHIFYDSIRKRTIRADIYHTFNPEGSLVVMSHGFAADRRFLQYLASHLASYGLTVVSVEHPGSNIDALGLTASRLQLKDLLPASEFVERPKDISFVLNELEGLNRSNGSFQGKFNTRGVTIIGHSFGGYTALALAGGRLNPLKLRQICQSLPPLGRSPADWLQCSAAALPYKQMSFRDYRIARAIVLNPMIGYLFDSDLAEITIPILMLSSTGDGITPILDHQLQPFDRLKGEKYLIVADGATHMSVTDISYLRSAMGQSTLVREVMDNRAEPIRKMMRGVSLAFIQQSTEFASLYQPYLSSTYVESFSGPQIHLRLTQTLPDQIKAFMTILSLDRPQIQPAFMLSQPSWLEESVRVFSNVFISPDFRTEKLGSVFGELLYHYDRTFDPWG